MYIKPITLRIKKDIWEKFVSNIKKTRTINGTIVELIEKYNEGCKNENRLFIPKK